MNDTPEQGSTPKDAQKFNAAAAQEEFLKPKQVDPKQPARWDSSKFWEARKKFDEISSKKGLDIDEGERQLASLFSEAKDDMATALSYDSYFSQSMQIVIYSLEHPEYSSAYDQAAQFVRDQLPIIAEAVDEAKENRDEIQRDGLTAVALLAKFGTKDDREKAFRFLSDRKEIISRSLIDRAKFGQIGVPEVDGYQRVLLTLLDSSDTQTFSELGDRLLGDFIQQLKTNPEDGSMLLSSVAREMAKNEGIFPSGQKLDLFLNRLLINYGLEGGKLKTVWYQNNPKHEEAVESNVATICKLELSRHGSTRLLNREFGIQNFGRYPTELLEKQYDELEDASKPYGVGLYPLGDHNGASYGQSGPLTDLLRDLDREGYYFRVVEAGSISEIESRLKNLKGTYGDVSFAVIFGHGRRESIDFGEDKLTVEDLQGPQAQGLEGFFRSGLPIVLASCATGAEGGIRDKLEERFGASVVAPRVPTGIKAYHAEKTPSGLRLTAEYTEEVGLD